MAAFDAAAISGGVPALELMERAGKALDGAALNAQLPAFEAALSAVDAAIASYLADAGGVRGA